MPKGNKNLHKHAKPYQFKSGQSGNLSGRPVGVKSIARILREQLQEPASCSPWTREMAVELDLDPKKSTVASVLSLTLCKRALAGDGTYANMLFQQLDKLSGQSITKAQLARIANAIVQVITNEVPDPQIRSNIGERIAALVGSFNDEEEE